MLKCSDGSYYTGITTSLVRRMEEHSSNKKGSKYVRSRLPFELVYQTNASNRSLAQKHEAQIKKLSHHDKEELAKFYQYLVLNMKSKNPKSYEELMQTYRKVYGNEDPVP